MLNPNAMYSRCNARVFEFRYYSRMFEEILKEFWKIIGKVCIRDEILCGQRG